MQGQCVAYCGDGEVFSPPPSSTSLPPGPPGATYVQRVITEFKLQGDIAAFDADAFKTALLAEFPSATKIDLRFTSGSITVVAEMEFSTEGSARAAANKVDTTPVSTMQSVWFASVGQIVILQKPVASIAQALVVNESPPSSPPLSPSSTALETNASALAAIPNNSTETPIPEAVMAISIAIPMILVTILIIGMVFKCRRHHGTSFLSRITHSLIPPAYPSVVKDSLAADIQQARDSDAAEDTESALVQAELENLEALRQGKRPLVRRGQTTKQFMDDMKKAEQVGLGI